MNPHNPIDLHCHSHHSDGVLSPQALIAHAAEAGIRMLALTDHDTLTGLPAAEAAARQHGLQLIPGVEMSASWANKTLHIVGLAIDRQHPALQQHLQPVQAYREHRAEQIAERLARAGIADALARTQALAGHRQLTRSHFARMLVDSGHCKDQRQAFKRYLAAGKPAAVSSTWPDMQDCIACIHAAGGMAVLAHPLRYQLSASWRGRLLTAFKAAGGDALEVSAGASQSPQDVATCAAAAREHGLLASQGSDLHDPAQRWIRYAALQPLPSDLTPIWTRFS